MTTAILFGVSCGMLTFGLGLELCELWRLRALCRRCAEHLSNEHRIDLLDPETNAVLIAECERAGWTNGGKER